MLLGAATLLGCAFETDGDDVDRKGAALTATQQRIFGFESPVADWQSSNGTSVSPSTTKTEGTYSLQFSPNGYTEVFSDPVAVPGAAGDALTFDLRLSSGVPWGDVRVVLKAPSAGLYWQDLGSFALTGLPAGAFQTVSFPLAPAVRQALSGSATDLEVRLIFNLPGGNTLQVDRLSFGGGVSTVPTSQYELAVVVPQGVPIADSFIAATGRLTIDDRSTLGETGQLENVSNLGPQPTEFGAGVRTFATVRSVGTVNFLRSSSTIAGSLLASGNILRQNNVTVAGGIFPGVAIPAAETRWTVDWPAVSAGNVTRAPDAPNLNLQHGRYGAIQIFSRATLTLSSGTYYADSLRIEPEANLRIDSSAGPVLFYVKDSLVLHTTPQYFAGDRGQLLFGYFGTTAANFERAFVGSVVAPNAAIELRRPTSGIHEGSFFGKEVHVFSDSVVKHLPFSFTFLCPTGDFDGDGTLNCFEECWNDPNKTDAGVCGCGKPDTDTDGDRIPNCIDQCDSNPNDSWAGDCGCLGESNLAAAGTPCADSVARGVFTCNATGVCGDPTSVAPLPGCVLKTVRARAYWICDGSDIGGPRTQAEAEVLCDQVEGRSLLQIDSAEENAILANLVDGPSWIGAVDRTTEGTWSWLDVLRQEKTRFWSGGATGASVGGRFTRWLNGAPVTDSERNCATIDRDGRWRVESCTATRSFVCENTFGPLVTPGGSDGALSGGPTRLRPQGIVPGWNEWEKSSVSQIDPALCTPLPPAGTTRDEWRAQAEAELEACDTTCGPEAEPSPDQAACDAACSGAAEPPPANAPSCDPGGALTNLDVLVPLNSSGQPACLVVDPATIEGTPEEIQAAVDAAQDCSEFGPLYRCGTKTSCYRMVMSSGRMVAQTCSATQPCNSGHSCVGGKCVDPTLKSACDTKQGDRCVGQCFAEVGCGFNFEDLFPWNSFSQNQPCGEEVRYCPKDPIFTEEFAHPELVAPQTFDPEQELPAETVSEEAKAYSTDFSNPPCEGAGGTEVCELCFPPSPGASSAAFRAHERCLRRQRHSWCTYDASPGGYRDDTDDREANRGDASRSTIEFKVDPVADIRFGIDPLPFGLAKFDVVAAAALKADVAFDVGLGIEGRVEIANIRAQLVASLCRVSTKDSRMEVLGVDFLPGLANDAIFDTNELGFDGEACEEAVIAYIDAVDRAKKAFRDAQDLLTQYKGLLADGRTFGPNFCTEIFGTGARPDGFEGECPEPPETVINRFIDFYVRQLGVPARNGQPSSGIYAAMDRLVNEAVDIEALEALVSGSTKTGTFGFQKRLVGVEDKKTITILATNFFIGPIPATLEVQSYLDYSIEGAFGATVDSGVLLRQGGGSFAKAGVEVLPKVSSGVTLFVGAGFNFGPLALQVGIEGGVVLAEASIPATVAAGLAMVPSPDRERELPADLSVLSSGRPLFPPGGLQKYDLSFDVTYGMTLRLENMLGGYLDGAVKISFFFFSQKFSQRIVEFQGFSPPPIELLNGGVEVPIADGLSLWRPQFPSVPFVDLLKLPRLDLTRPENASIVQNASYDATIGKKLFYDYFCTCREDGDACRNSEECCNNNCGGPAGSQTCGGEVSCLPGGASCQEPAECCTGNCSNGTCQGWIK